MAHTNFTNRDIDYAKIYSPSKLSLFSKCPKAYHFSYLDPIYSKMKKRLKKLPENIWSFNTLGRAVHNAITLFFHLPAKQRKFNCLKAYLEKTWRSEVMPRQNPPLGKWGGFSSTQEEREQYRQALQMLKNFTKLIDDSLQIHYLPTKNLDRSIDDYLQLIKPLNDSYDISGKFDLIAKFNDDSLHIIDFKTGKRNDEDIFQLRFYKLLAEENFKKPVTRASYYFLSSGHIKDFDFGTLGTGDIKAEIAKKISEIHNTEAFEAQSSKLCKFCLYKTFCTKAKEVRKIIEETKELDYADDLPF